MTTPAGIAPGANSFSIGDHGRFSTRGSTARSTTTGLASPPDDAQSASPQDSGFNEGSTFHSVLHHLYSPQTDDEAHSAPDQHKRDNQNKDNSDPAASTLTSSQAEDGLQPRNKSSILRNLMGSISGTAIQAPSEALSSTGSAPPAEPANAVLTSEAATALNSSTPDSSTSSSSTSSSSTSSNLTSTAAADGAAFSLTDSTTLRNAVTIPSGNRPKTSGPDAPAADLSGAKASPSKNSGGLAIRFLAHSNSSSATTKASSLQHDAADEPETHTIDSEATDSPVEPPEPVSLDEGNVLSPSLSSQFDAHSLAQVAGSADSTRQAQDNAVPTSVSTPPRTAKARPVGPTTVASQTAPSQTPADQNETSIATNAVTQVATEALVSPFKGTKTTDATAQARVNTALPPFEAHTTASGSSGEVAFAARLTPGGNSPDNPVADKADSKPRTTQIPERQPGASYQLSTDPADRPPANPIEQLVKADLNVSMPQPVAATAQAASSIKSEAAPAQPSPSPAARMEQVLEMPTAAPASNRDITVRVPDSTERGTDVRFLERGGEVHVMVRTSDAEMAQTLRGGLSDLVGRMEHTGIRTEVWKPGQDAPPMQGDSQNQSFEQNGDQKHGQHGSGSGRNPQDAQEREPGRQDAEKPRWVEELETSLTQNSNPRIQ